MDSVHKRSSYRQSCIHPPRHPKSHHPSPSFERQPPKTRRRLKKSVPLGHDSLDDDQGDFDRELDSSSSRPLNRRGRIGYGSDAEDVDEDLFDPKVTLLDELEKENYRFRSMSDFYDSIPDYNDLHHLSETEFYARLERLKIQQQELMDLVEGTTSSGSPRIKLDTTPLSEPVLARAGDEARVDKSLDREGGEAEDSNSLLSLESVAKPNRPTSSCMSKAKKSVRISSGTTYRTDYSDWNDEFLDEGLPLNTRSKSVSPRRSLTVPKPFKMTQREEEEKMMDELAQSKRYLSKISINFDDHPPNTTRRPKIRPFKANPVPLTSRIPLYEHIKEDHRRKSALAKLNSAIELQSQIKPFKFTTDRPVSRCLSRAASTPNLTQTDEVKPFKANPCPKNLFSNYFYNKMWEDEYFRSLNKRLRAEEMLKISNLPPSMAKRAETYFELTKSHKSRKKKKKSAKRPKNYYDFKDKDLVDQSSQKSSGNRQSNGSVISSSCESTPVPSAYPVNRPNLAATLRVQSARQKVRELSKPKSIVPDNRLTAKGPVRSSSRDAWGVKKSSAWKSMSYDPSNMEDIAMRLATRKAEQRLRQEEHEISMELMKQRVRAAPLLLEGPTHWGPKVGQVSHQCRATEMGNSPSNSHRRKRTPTRNSSSSKLSFYDAKE